MKWKPLTGGPFWWIFNEKTGGVAAGWGRQKEQVFVFPHVQAGILLAIPDMQTLQTRILCTKTMKMTRVTRNQNVRTFQAKGNFWPLFCSSCVCICCARFDVEKDDRKRCLCHDKDSISRTKRNHHRSERTQSASDFSRQWSKGDGNKRGQA